MNNKRDFKTFINHCLHKPETRVAKFVNGSLVFLIIFSIAVIPLHFLPEMSWAKSYLITFDKITITVFTIEYFLRIWAADRKAAYVFSWWGLIDLLAILPFYLAKIGLISRPEIFMALRILRILKLGKIYEIERNAISECATNEHGEFRVLDDENIERVVQKHPLVFMAKLIMPLVMTTVGLTIIVFFQGMFIATIIAIFFFIFAAIFFFKAWLDFNYDVIYITNRRVILQNRELFGAITNDITYESITNVKPSNIGIWHFLFGFGSVCIETASVDGALHFHEAPNPHEIVRHITKNRQLVLERRKVDNIQFPSTKNDKKTS